MCFQMLLHVVGPCELLGATLEGAGDRLFGSVDLGMPRGVARRGESLLAAVAVPIPTRIPLAGPFGGGRARGIVLIRHGSAVAHGARPLGTDVAVCVRVVLIVPSIDRVSPAIVIDGGHGGDGLIAHLRVIGVGSKQLWGVWRQRETPGQGGMIRLSKAGWRTVRHRLVLDLGGFLRLIIVEELDSVSIGVPGEHDGGGGSVQSKKSDDEDKDGAETAQ